MKSWLNFEKLFIWILKIYLSLFFNQGKQVFWKLLYIQYSWVCVIWHLCYKFLTIYPENIILNIELICSIFSIYVSLYNGWFLIVTTCICFQIPLATQQTFYHLPLAIHYIVHRGYRDYKDVHINHFIFWSSKPKWKL